MKAGTLRRTASLARKASVRKTSAKQARKNRAKGPIRLQVFERDGHRCRFAVLGAGSCFGPLEAHHVVKDSQGGEYTTANLVTLCQHHNQLIEQDGDVARLARIHGLVKSPDRTFKPHQREAR